jgi:energy-coupling factor transporter ATP-binding protein EcfA2
MRPIPAPRIGDSHGLLRAIGQRERIRLDEFVTEFSAEDLFPPGLENAFGRTRQFVSYARAAGLLKEDRGTVELTEIGKRYVRAGDPERVFGVSEQQAEWLRRQVLEKHMTDSIYHGLAIGLSLLSSVPLGTRISLLDFGRALSYLGRAGWDSENTLQIQGERYAALMQDIGLIDKERLLTPTGRTLKDELTLPIHMSLMDIATQLNPGGADAVRAQGEAEWAALSAPPEAPRAAPEPATPAAAEPAEPAPAAEEEDEWTDAGPSVFLPSVKLGEGESGPPAREPPRPAVAPEPAAPPPPAAAPEPAAPPPPAATPEPPGPPPAPDPGPWGAPEPAPAAPPPETPAADPAPAASARPVPPDDIWEDRAAPDAATRAYAKIPAPEPAPPPRQEAPTVVTPPRPQPAAARQASDFLPAAAIRGAAEARGLRLPASVYANVSAALASGKHVLLTGAPGAGKTTLALAVVEAAAHGGRSAGGVLVTAEEGRSDQVLDAARRGRWLIVDELDRAEPDRLLGPLSTFLAGLPVTIAGGEEATPPREWRMIATASAPGGGSPALVRRLAHVHLPTPADGDLDAVIGAAAQGDQTAAAAARRLLTLRELRPLGAGVFADAARHAAERNAIDSADERTLAREAYAAYLQGLLTGLGDRDQARLRELVESL